ncbi:hypothetical protein BCR32DRAFT_265035 [Anaeromyces robustus]|uniref:Uncharacterized protein n=1 Tax=Anaeromyces robustus TaxID=1754192 RepID=A0A1Y1XKS3_9FUNG|nr:hypothetical protein BCR32DRAFT_265035 [Anaeromyces robustus]|eukprot:ORX86348.1 hypothetical protein BCR32DRAFT_265035 [Anaeromyces robustus]
MNKKTSNIKKIIPLSPNEEKAFQENEERKKRILRLQQVRSQGKTISENKTSIYNSSVEEELKHLIKLIKAEWNKNYVKKVDNFFELKKITKNYIGAAQANAKIQRNEEELKKEKLLIKLYDDRIKENERYIEARRKQCQESLEKVQDITNYIKNQYIAVTTSNKREKCLIDQYREKQRNMTFLDDNNTLISFKNDSGLMKKKNYNDSIYHRDYNVVRCDPQRNIYNASDVAFQKTKQGLLNIENNQKKLKESIQITKDRYRKAIAKMNDEKQKDLFIKNLQTLEKIDILRKKENIKNSFKDQVVHNMYNINLDLSDANKNDYCINYYTNKELDKIPKELEKSMKKEWKNVGTLPYGNTSRPVQRNNKTKKQTDKITNIDKNHNLISKSNDYSICDKCSIVNQDVIRKVLLHQYP